MKNYKKNVASCVALMGICLSLQSLSSHAAKCEYLINNEWSTGFVANIRITNDTSALINNWSVSWAYSDGSAKTSSWNATVTGNNPYTATNLDWNKAIAPGQYVEFGVQGNKSSANTPAAKPAVTGAICSSGPVTSSSSGTSSSKSSTPVRSSLASSTQVRSSTPSSIALSSQKSSTPTIPSSKPASSRAPQSSFSAESSVPPPLPPPTPVAPATAAKYTMVVDVANKQGPLKKAGIGSLFGFHRAMTDISAEDFLLPIQMQTSQWQSRIGENGRVVMSIEASLEVARASKSKMLCRFNDLLYGWPYNWKSLEEWRAQVEQAMGNVKSYTDVVYAIAPFNEPDNKFLGAFMTDPAIQGSNYDARVNWLWTYTVRLIRSHNTGLKILGPNYEHYRPWDAARGDQTRMRNFLVNAINTNTVPEIMGWHSLGPSPGDVPEALNKYYRPLETELNVPGRPLPIAIEEFGPGTGDFEGVPGTLMKHFAEFERAHVDWAAMAVFTAGGALGNTLRSPWDYQGPNAGWWLLKWYREMTGEYVYVDRWDKRLYQSFDGLASVDTQQKKIQVLVGGSDDDGDILIRGLTTAGLGSEVRVQVELAHWQKDSQEFDRDIEAAGDINLGTDIIYEKEFTVGTANELRVPIRRMNKYDAYRISVTSINKSAEPNLIARYKFEPGVLAKDAQGGRNIGLFNVNGIAKGKYLDGGAVRLNGTNAYAELPDGIIDRLTDFTVATWVKVDAKTPWARVFDFGKSDTSYMQLTLRDAQDNIRFEIANNGAKEIMTASGDLIKAGIWHHVAVTLRGSNTRLFIDGNEVATNNSVSLRPNQLIPSVNNYLGRSQFAADPYLAGAMDDTRLYGRALSRFEVSDLISHKYEAEKASVTNGVLHAGNDALFQASNNAYVGGLDFANSKLDFSVNVPRKGIYVMAVRYANGLDGNAIDRVTVNNQTQENITFTATGGWLNNQTQIARSRVLLNAGDNQISIARESGSAELDYIDLSEDTHQYQAELAKITAARFATQFFGIDGVKGFVGSLDTGDSTIEFAIDAPTSGIYRLKIAYANGIAGEGSHSVIVNGNTVTTATYSPTGGWFSSPNPTASRRITEVTLELSAGYSRVVLRRASGHAEIDYVQLLAN